MLSFVSKPIPGKPGGGEVVTDFQADPSASSHEGLCGPLFQRMKRPGQAGTSYLLYDLGRG